jgi:hypothetical protein
MKTVTIRYEFPDDYDHNEIVSEINGSISDMNGELATELSYTVLERK